MLDLPNPDEPPRDVIRDLCEQIGKSPAMVRLLVHEVLSLRGQVEELELQLYKTVLSQDRRSRKELKAKRPRKRWPTPGATAVVPRPLWAFLEAPSIIGLTAASTERRKGLL